MIFTHPLQKINYCLFNIVKKGNILSFKASAMKRNPSARFLFFLQNPFGFFLKIHSLNCHSLLYFDRYRPFFLPLCQPFNRLCFLSFCQTLYRLSLWISHCIHPILHHLTPFHSENSSFFLLSNRKHLNLLFLYHSSFLIQRIIPHDFPVNLHCSFFVFSTFSTSVVETVVIYDFFPNQMIFSNFRSDILCHYVN